MEHLYNWAVHRSSCIKVSICIYISDLVSISEYLRNEVEKIEAWIRDKELMVSQGDLGKDYEHCLELQKKLDDVDGDMRVDESR